eukprot:s2664_g12.t1
MDEKGNPLDPYRALFLDAENPSKKMKRAEDENPYDAFPRAWQHYWQNTVVPMAAKADEKIRARMEVPTLWECLEVFNLQKELAIGKYLIPSDDDCFRMLGCQASVKLEGRLTVQEYVCYIVRRVVSNLDAYGAETFEPAFEDALDPDIDGEVKLKAGDAPDEQLRLKAKAPMITQTLLDAQRAVMTADTATPPRQCPMQTVASATADAGQKEFEDSAPTAHWRQFMKPSEAMANKVAEFEQSSHGFKLAQEQLSACRSSQRMKSLWQTIWMPHRVQSEHYAAQSALMSIETVIHLKKSKRFLDEHLPEITAAMRVSSPNTPLSEDHLIKLRSRKIENCHKELSTDLFRHGHVVGMYWENIARSMVERAHRDAQELDVPLFCLQAADQRHSRRNKTIDKQLTHQLLTVPNPHRTGKLQGMLLVHENMVVRLADVLAPRLGLVKDKLAVVVKVDLHHADQQRGLEDSDWWLAIYVMLTRARKLENLILLGFTDQVEELLRKGPPTYLRDLTDKLEAWPSYDALHRK